MKMIELNMITGEDEDQLPVTTPVTILVDKIRSFRSRRGAAGTRIEFPNSAAILVTEPYAEVKGAVQPQ